MRSLLQDLRFALRRMRHSPGFALTAIITLALGIGANVAVFGVLQALILRPFDVPHADRVMTLQPDEPGSVNLSWPEVRDVRDQNKVFSSVAALRINDFGLEASNTTHPVWGYEISGEYFNVLRIRPALGRLLQPADDAHPGASQVAVLSWAAWKSYFGGDPAIIGKTVRIDKHPCTIVGVTPAGFYGTEKFLQPDLFVPMANEEEFEGYSWLETRYNHGSWSIVSLRDGVTLPQAQADVNAIAARVAKQYPKEEEHLKLRLTKPGLAGDLFGAPARGFLAGVMGLAGIVLLAACANLGSLFAARTADRAREIAIRMAIGSSRQRIVRQILTEAAVIAVAGGACAGALAWFGLSALGHYRPPSNFPIQLAVMPQPSLLAAAFLLSILAAMLFGIMPLRQILAADPNEAIKTGSSHQGAGRRWAFRDVLLAVQIALCCVTVTAAFVSLRGLQKAVSMQFGFDPDNAVITKFDLGLAGYRQEDAARFQHRLLDRVLQLPGVRSAGYANTTPLALDQSTWSVYPQSAVEFRPSTEAFDASVYSISPGYLHAAGTKLLFGRDASQSDGPKAPPVAIVNREFARRLFHTDQATGRYFKDGSGHLVQIIGVVEDGKYQGLSEAQQPAMFHSIEQSPYTSMSLVVRPRPGVTGMAATLRQVVRELDPAVPVQESSGWRHQLGLQLFPARAATMALGLFGLFGLLLSITGTFGLASYTVTKRLRELSIRVALGAQAKQIVSASLGRMLVLLAAGSSVGLLLGVAASRLLAAIVYQASAQDPLVLFTVALTMLLTGALSIAGPVQRALRIDPARLLRED
ncbi:ABC transporter permease [Paracidobacterium acidisoli]|uniref:ABC transporter substrate-binding protein n=1 Tax=Paracidobacterium acidisoli TaxID=2303751 RepID=A0A372IPG6_9BACT|nr:ABC transporter permease [Paracidobacterium acidisoli]MBT9331163.1 ABC transporter permease [Paracidobacterium acidisoli]